MTTHPQEIRSLESKKNQKSKEKDRIHPHLNKKTKNLEIEIGRKILADRDKEVIRGKGTRRKIKIEDIETVNKEKVGREKEVEVKIKINRGIEKKKQNKSLSKLR